MRKYLGLFIVLFAPIFATSAYAAKCNYSPQYVSCFNTSGKVTLGYSCSQTGHICFDDTDYSYCRSCNSGFEEQDRIYTHSSGCTIEYTTCVFGGGQEIACKGCPDALDGPTYTDWVNAPYNIFASSTVTVPGYQVRTKTTCDESTSWECKNTTEVRCAKGWYGLRPQQTTSSSSSGGGIAPVHYEYSGCTQCPEFNGGDGNTVSGQSAAGTAAEITDCYVEYDGENPFYDNTGSYIFISPCYYSYESGDCRVHELATGATCKSATPVWGLGMHCETTKYIRLDSADMCFSQCATCPSGYEMLIRTTTYSGCNITFQTCGEI